MGKWLKKYMKIEHLESTLRDGKIHLGSPSEWEDGNDCELIRIYRGKCKIDYILATCFTMAADRYHFWDIYGKKKKGVCLWFDKIELINDFRKDESLRYDKVSYHTPKDLEYMCKTPILPFAKRAQYKDEQEFRVLRELSIEEINNFSGVAFLPNSLKRIYFNSWLTGAELSKEKEKINEILKNNYPKFNKKENLKQNRITHYKKWIDAAKNVKE